MNGTEKLIDNLSTLFNGARVDVCHDRYAGRQRWWVNVNGEQITPVGGPDHVDSMLQALRLAYSAACSQMFDEEVPDKDDAYAKAEPR